MNRQNNFDKYNSLRQKYKTFYFDSFDFTIEKNNISVYYNFSVDNSIFFKPYTIFEFPCEIKITNTDEIKTLLFNLGMVELISYWKATCAEKIIIKPYCIDKEQIAWWKELYFNGLGEFFYLNSIEANPDSFMNIECISDTPFKRINKEIEDNGIIVPVGGGKDSIVSIEFFKNTKSDIFPMLVNARGAMTDTINTAVINKNKILNSKRTIDPVLLDLNKQGFLNGHTPFSSLLAFQSLIFSYVMSIKDIALSNESSANESTVKETKINHQYSKSLEFENNFRTYVQKYISKSFNYYSVLRPLSELQIAYIFSKFQKYFPVFRSCNVGSKTDTWCGKCPKCLFTAIILHPFLNPEQIKNIFGYDIFNNSDLLLIFKQLIGEEPTKPFECVGTTEEISIALNLSLNHYNENELPFLLKYFKQTKNYSTITKEEFNRLIFNDFNKSHNLTKDQYEQIVSFIGNV